MPGVPREGCGGHTTDFSGVFFTDDIRTCGGHIYMYTHTCKISGSFQAFYGTKNVVFVVLDGTGHAYTANRTLVSVEFSLSTTSCAHGITNIYRLYKMHHV